MKSVKNKVREEVMGEVLDEVWDKVMGEVNEEVWLEVRREVGMWDEWRKNRLRRYFE